MKLYMQNELGEGENIPEFLSPKRVIFILNSLKIKSMYRHNMTKAFFFQCSKTKPTISTLLNSLAQRLSKELPLKQFAI